MKDLKAEINFTVGDTHHIIIGYGRPNKIHIVAIVEKYMIVFRWYDRHKQYWHYVIKHKDILNIEIEISRTYKNAI